MIARAQLLLCACGAYVSTLGPSISRAQGASYTVRIDYAGGPGCPDTQAFAALVSARLGYEPFVDEAPDRVLVHIMSRGAALEGRIEWRDLNGRWVGDQSVPMASKDCRHLARALAAALAVQIQLLATTTVPDGTTRPANGAMRLPEASAQSIAPSSPIVPISPSDRRAPALGVEPTTSDAPPRPRPVFAMGVGSAIGVGMSSIPVLVGRLLGSLAWQHLAIELGAEVSVPTTTRRVDGSGFTQQHVLASAAGCAMFAPWSTCLLTKTGEVRMAGKDIDRPSSAVAPVIEAGARVGIGQIFGRRFLVDAHVDGLANLVRWSAALDRVPVWSAPRFCAAIGIDAVVRFP